MAGLDPRIVQVGIEINGEIDYYEGLQITARGTRYGSDTLNECQVRIDNLKRATRDFILTQTSPFNINQTPKRLIVNAGRQSYGASLVFIGVITTSEVTQPPDIGIILNALTGYDQSGNIIAFNTGPVAPLSAIAQRAADDTGTTLNFQATDKNIANYSYTGPALQHVNKIAQIGNVDAFIDNKTLVVKNQYAPLQGRIKFVSQDTGMIGIPEITEQGVRVRFLMDNQTTVGDQINIKSQLNPAIDGNYVIYKLGFDIASRDVPFYWIAECKRLS